MCQGGFRLYIRGFLEARAEATSILNSIDLYEDKFSVIVYSCKTFTD